MGLADASGSMALELLPIGLNSAQALGFSIFRPYTRTLYDIGFVMYESKGALLLCTVHWFAPGKRTRMMIVREFGTVVHTHTDAQRFALYEGMGPRVNGMY